MILTDRIGIAETFLNLLNEDETKAFSYLRDLKRDPSSTWRFWLKQIMKNMQGKEMEALVFIFISFKEKPNTLRWITSQLSLDQQRNLILGFSCLFTLQVEGEEKALAFFLTLLPEWESFLIFNTCEVGNWRLLKFLLANRKEELKPMYLQAAIDNQSIPCLTALIGAGMQVEKIYLAQAISNLIGNDKKETKLVVNLLEKHVSEIEAEEPILIATKTNDLESLEKWVPRLTLKKGALAESCIHWAVKTNNRAAFDLFVKNGFGYWATDGLIGALNNVSKNFRKEVRSHLLPFVH